jgi:hypothetical protein
LCGPKGRRTVPAENRSVSLSGSSGGNGVIIDFWVNGTRGSQCTGRKKSIHDPRETEYFGEQKEERSMTM